MQGNRIGESCRGIMQGNHEGELCRGISRE